MKTHACIASLGLLVAGNARADAANDKAIAIGGNLSVSHGQVRGNEGTYRLTTIAATPTLDVLVSGGLSLGVEARVWHTSYASDSSTRSTSFQPSARLGYFFPIGAHAAFWPVVSAGYGFTWSSFPTPDGMSDGRSGFLDVALTPQFLLLPSESFFVRFSPGMATYRSTRTHGAPSGGLVSVGFVNAIGVGVRF